MNLNLITQKINGNSTMTQIRRKQDRLVDNGFWCFRVILLSISFLSACVVADRTHNTNRDSAANLIVELENLLDDQKQLNRKLEQGGDSARELAREKTILSNHPEYSSMLKKVSQWRAKRLADPAKATILDAQLKAAMSGDENRVYLKRLELYEQGSILVNDFSNVAEQNRQLHQSRLTIYLNIRDGLDSIILNKLEQQLTLLSQEETAEVTRRELLAKDFTETLVVVMDLEK